MRTAKEIAGRIQGLENAKLCLLFPPRMYTLGKGAQRIEDRELKRLDVSEHVTLESLNAEIAALTWMLEGEGQSENF